MPARPLGYREMSFSPCPQGASERQVPTHVHGKTALNTSPRVPSTQSVRQTTGVVRTSIINRKSREPEAEAWIINSRLCHFGKWLSSSRLSSTVAERWVGKGGVVSAVPTSLREDKVAERTHKVTIANTDVITEIQKRGVSSGAPPQEGFVRRARGVEAGRGGRLRTRGEEGWLV